MGKSWRMDVAKTDIYAVNLPPKTKKEWKNRFLIIIPQTFLQEIVSLYT